MAKECTIFEDRRRSCDAKDSVGETPTKKRAGLNGAALKMCFGLGVRRNALACTNTPATDLGGWLLNLPAKSKRARPTPPW